MSGNEPQFGYQSGIPGEEIRSCPIDGFGFKLDKNSHAPGNFYTCFGCGLSIPEEVIENKEKVCEMVARYEENVVLTKI